MASPPSWFKRLAVPIADRIVYASGAYVSVKSTLNDLSSALITFDGEPGNQADDRLLRFARLIRPMDSPHLSLTRVGGTADGGYVMAAPIAAGGALSIGVGSDVSWDFDIGSRGIPVAMFDHTVRKAPSQVPNGTFHKIGVGPVAAGRVKPLDELVGLAGFQGGSDLYLKMDVEGAEWPVLTNPRMMDLRPFTQVVLELHDLGDLKVHDRGERMIDAVQRLTASHYPVHVHANNYDELVRFGDWWFPNALEVSFVRQDLLQQARPATTLRTELDAPCDPRVTEIDLSALARL